MNNEALPIFKVLADETRLKILRALDEKESYVELLAERLSLTPATVSFHMKKLLAAGLVDARREQYYTIYSIRREFFRATLQSLIFQSDGGETAEELREEAYRRKVIRAFMPDGVCHTMPAQLKKRLIIYEEIFSHFDPKRAYTEKEVNAVIAPIHEDFCSVRRTFIALGWMTRSGGVYTVNPKPDKSDLTLLRL